MWKHYSGVSVMAVLLAGCATTPITADEMREYVRKKGTLSAVETFVVNRSYAAVTRSLKTAGDNCLNKTFRVTSKPTGLLTIGGTQDHGTTHYIPVAKIGPTRAEFYTKFNDSRKRSANLEAGDQFIFYVADVTPRGANATNVTLYHWTADRYLWARDFVKAWARGEDPGCPTLSGRF